MDDLKPRVNIPAAIARGALSQVPILGPIANEIVGQIIPDRRWERITALVHQIEVRVSNLEPATLRGRFTEPIYVDLLEEGMFQGARASSPERIAYIAEIIARGVSRSDAARLDRMWLLRLLSEINDAEALLLALHGKSGEGRSAFYERHQPAIEVPTLFFGENAPDKAATAAIRSNYERHLESLGLLQRRSHRPPRGQMPDLDENGKPTHSWTELAALGYLLLREIGQPADIDAFGEEESS